MQELTIRSAQPQDGLSVIAVFTAARSEMTYLPVLHTQKETEQFLLGLINKGHVWVAEQDGSVVGFMEVEGGWLHHLYVAPHAQKHGVGTQLLEKAKAVSPQGLFLWVFEQNTGAIRLYEREGFHLVEKRTQEEADNEEHLPDRKYLWTL